MGMMSFSAATTIEALAGATGVEYTFNYDLVIAGLDSFDPADIHGVVPNGSKGTIWPANGNQGVLRIWFFETTGAAIQVTLYKNSHANPFTTFLVPMNGSAVWDGNGPQLYDQFGSRV